MRLNQKTLEKLREIINGDGTADYRKGYDLVNFFNQLGFKDVYGQGFPSRWVYTDDKLQRINGRPELDKCIRNAFAVVNYVGRIADLDTLISDFNQYLAFDKWQVVRNNDEITFRRLEKIVIGNGKVEKSEVREEDFLNIKFIVNIDSLGLDAVVAGILKERIQEAEACMKNSASLAAIFLIGSIMEGVFLGVAGNYPRQFNASNAAPKDDTGKVRQFYAWTLNDFINTACDIGVVGEDVKKFSHAVRDFRNYIHPYQQMASRFSPDLNTATICFQVLKAAICQIEVFRKTNKV